MAVFPCDIGTHRYTSPQFSAYPSLVRGSERRSRKLRLCEAHFDGLLVDTHAENVEQANEAWDGRMLNCWTCGADTGDTGWALFVTLYRPGHAREDWWANLCADCATVFGLDYRLPVS